LVSHLPEIIDVILWEKPAMQDSNVLRDFALDANGLSTLASLQLGLLEEDIAKTKSKALLGDNRAELQNLKKRWCKSWKKMVQLGFNELPSDLKPVFWTLTSQDLQQQLDKLSHDSDRTTAGLILIELVVWDAYWPFKKDQKEFKDLEIDSDLHKTYLELAATQLGFKSERAEQLRGSIESAHKGLTGYWWKLAIGVAAGLGIGALTMGIAAPFIGGAIGGAALGLSGAAATSAGLAALGGGAIAAGGLGIAGGTAVIVGGGAVLGMGVGGAIGRVTTALQAESVLLSSAKLEVVLKEFVLQGQHDTAKVQEILFAQRKSIHALEEELDRLKIAGDTTDARIKQLENSIEIMRKALKRNQDIVT
jgi:hypothetical protein